MENQDYPDDQELREELIKKFRNQEIKYKDLPKRFRDEIVTEIIGRKPIKRFENLPVVNK